MSTRISSRFGRGPAPLDLLTLSRQGIDDQKSPVSPVQPRKRSPPISIPTGRGAGSFARSRDQGRPRTPQAQIQKPVACSLPLRARHLAEYTPLSTSPSPIAEHGAPVRPSADRGRFTVFIDKQDPLDPSLVTEIAAIRLRSFNCIEDIKTELQSQQQVGAVREQRIFYRGSELRDIESLHASGLREGSRLFFSRRVPGLLLPHGRCSSAYLCHDMIERCTMGVEAGYMPQLAFDGTGGPYFMRDASGSRVAVFKPRDEEAHAPNNPRGEVGPMGSPTHRQGILSGEGACREVAAFLLDHEGFAGVPLTTRVEASIPDAFHYSNGVRRPSVKVGSLQEFVTGEAAGNMSRRLFPASEVHKIGILDIRLLNTDRNDANILVNRDRGKITLTPIDHGMCIPGVFEVAWCDWVWLDWPQAKEPFDEETLEYIRLLDIDADVAMLQRELPINHGPLLNIRIAGMILKVGAAAGLTLYQIANIICRDKLEVPSQLEVMCAQAEALTDSKLNRQIANPTTVAVVPSNPGSPFIPFLTPPQSPPRRLVGFPYSNEHMLAPPMQSGQHFSHSLSLRPRPAVSQRGVSLSRYAPPRSTGTGMASKPPILAPSSLLQQPGSYSRPIGSGGRRKPSGFAAFSQPTNPSPLQLYANASSSASNRQPIPHRSQNPYSDWEDDRIPELGFDESSPSPTTPSPASNTMPSPPSNGWDGAHLQPPLAPDRAITSGSLQRGERSQSLVNLLQITQSISDGGTMSKTPTPFSLASHKTLSPSGRRASLDLDALDLGSAPRSMGSMGSYTYSHSGQSSATPHWSPSSRGSAGSGSSAGNLSSPSASPYRRTSYDFQMDGVDGDFELGARADGFHHQPYSSQGGLGSVGSYAESGSHRTGMHVEIGPIAKMIGHTSASSDRGVMRTSEVLRTLVGDPAASPRADPVPLPAHSPPPGVSRIPEIAPRPPPNPKYREAVFFHYLERLTNMKLFKNIRGSKSRGSVGHRSQRSSTSEDDPLFSMDD